MAELLRTILRASDGVFLLAFAATALSQLALMVSAAALVSRRHRRALGPSTSDPRRSPLSPRVTALVPAFNECAVIESTVRALLTTSYPNIEVVVVNDGSTDATMATLMAAFELVPSDRMVTPLAVVAHRSEPTVYTSALHPNLVVIDSVNGGKAAALNTGLAAATGEYVCAVDADTLVDASALGELVQPFLDDRDVVAVGGTIRVVNGCEVSEGRVVRVRSPRSALAALQDVEYVRAFVFGRLGWNGLGGNIIISGAFGLFDASAVRAVGGYVEHTVGEDMELVLRLRRHAYESHRPGRVVFIPNPIAWTEVPNSLRTLARQRNRWQRGLLQTMWCHRDVVGRRRYGAMGMFVTPYYLVIELLEPLLEIVGLLAVVSSVATGVIDPGSTLAVALLGYGLVLCAGLWALALDAWIGGEERTAADWAHRLVALIVEPIGFRQLTMCWRIWGMWSAVRGVGSWGVQQRHGYDQPVSMTTVELA